MKNTSKLNRMVSEEVVEMFEAKGIVISEEDLESVVSRVVEDVECEVDACIACEAVIPIEEGSVAVGGVLMATQDIDLTGDDGSVSVASGDFIVVTGVDSEDDAFVIVDVYGADGEISEENITVLSTDVEDLVNNEFVVLLSDEDVAMESVGSDNFLVVSVGEETCNLLEGMEDIDEIFKQVIGGKIKKFKLKAKAGFKRVGGRYVRMSSKMKNALKRAGKKMGRKFGKSKASLRKRLKTIKKMTAKGFYKKPRRINASAIVEDKSFRVEEGFDIDCGTGKIVLENNDILTLSRGSVTVVREGKEIVNSLKVDKDFEGKCVTEGLLKEVDETEVIPPVEEEGDVPPVVEGSLLSYVSGTGYVYTCEGRQTSLGNRVRARAFLVAEGVTVTGEDLDKASNGEAVILV